MNAIKPHRLRRGDLIGLVSPASRPSPPEKIEKSVRYLEAQGYRVKVGDNVSREHGYLAGTDAERAADFNAMILDREVKAVFALRGGYGTPRILPLVRYAALRRQPKIISGFSDITGLQLAIYKKCRLVSFSGPMPAVEFWKDPDPFTEEHFWRLLTRAEPVGELPNPAGDSAATLRAGMADGVLLGGNLALVTALMGTPFLPSLRDALLVLEEIDEEPYRIDRMINQLALSDVARGVAGVIFGKFTHCEAKPDKPSLSLDSIFGGFAEGRGIPAATNFCYGHVPRKLTVPFGVRARLTAGPQVKVEVLDSAVV